MKTIKKTQFRRLQIIKLSGAYYVNSFVEKSIFITVEGVKFYKVSKSKLRTMGVIFAEDRCAPASDAGKIDETIEMKTSWDCAA